MSKGRVLFETASRISDQALRRIRKGIGAGGDVLISHKGTVGKVAYVPLDAPNFVCSPQTTFWRSLDQEELDRRYLYYFLCSGGFQLQLATRKGETDMADYVSLTNQRLLSVLVPPIDDQRAIANVLGALDDKIVLSQRISETLEAIARALFESWFVDFNPVRDKAEGREPDLPKEVADLFPDSLEESGLGEIPRGWGVGKVEDLGWLSREGLSPSDFPEDIFAHFSIPAFDANRTPRLEKGGAIKSHKFIVQQNAVLFSKLNPRIPRIWLPEVTNSKRAICSTEFLVVLPRMGIPREFLYCLFASKAFSNVFGTLVTGTSGSHQRVKPEGLLAMETVLPSLPVICQFAHEVRPLLMRVNRALDESHIIASLRDTLLPKLFAGDLRVYDAGRTIERHA